MPAPTSRPTVADLAADLAAGRTSSRALVEAALARIADPAGEGKRAFLKVYAEQARAAADAQDRLRQAGYVASPLAGLPVSIKDLFDVAGEQHARRVEGARRCAAGRARRANRRAAARGRRGAGRPHQHDRVRLLRRRHQSALRHARQSLRPQAHPRRLVRRARRSRSPTAWRWWRSAPTPAAPCASRRRSAASSGFKPTQNRVPLATARCRSRRTLDSIGPLANSVACCAHRRCGDGGRAAGGAAGDPGRRAAPRRAADRDARRARRDRRRGLRACASRCSRAPARDVVDLPLTELADYAAINATGGFSAARSLCLARAAHRPARRRLRSACARCASSAAAP